MNNSRQFCSSLAAAEAEATLNNNKYHEDPVEKQAAALDNLCAWLPHEELTPTPARRQRLLSVESHDSDSSKATSLGCSDSGNYSSANVSDSQQICGSSTSSVLRQKDQALFLALQDVRRLRSELERLSKSEKWYKQELRQQKHARLEALEKLYGNERNYMQENQRLQRECLRLYARCGEVENELEQQRLMVELEKQQQKQQQNNESLECTEGSQMQVFEHAQRRSQLADQQQLIEVLRKQKRTLLADLQRLNEEKDAQIFELQCNLAQLEADQQRVTKKCKSLLEERSSLEVKLKQKSDELQQQRSEQEQIEQTATATQLALVEQQRLLMSKELEIKALESNFKLTLREEEEPDAIHQLSLDYHRDIMQKTKEIAALKNALHALQQELDELSEVQSVNEQQQREIEQLQAALAEHDYELCAVQKSNAKKSDEILELKAEIAEYQCMTRSMEQQSQEKQNGVLAELLRSKEALKSAESELIGANERYASMCELCERTRFTLDMREIALGKLQFEKCRDIEEVQQLREKLASYLQQTAELSARIYEMEIELQKKRESLTMEQATQWEMQEVLLYEQESEEEIKKLAIWDLEAKLESDEDFANINRNLQEMHEYIKDLELENLALKGFIQRSTMDEVVDGAIIDKETNIFKTKEKLNDFKTTLKIEDATFLKNINDGRSLKTLVEIINEKKAISEAEHEQTTVPTVDLNQTKADVANENLGTMTRNTTLNSVESNGDSIKAAINPLKEKEQIFFSTSQEDSDFENTKLQELHLCTEELKEENKALKDRDILKEPHKALIESGVNGTEENTFLKDADFEHLNAKLQETHAFLKQLQQENENLKELLASSSKFFSEIKAREVQEKDKQEKELQANRGQTKNFIEILQLKLEGEERKVKYKDAKKLQEPGKGLQGNHGSIEKFNDQDLKEKETQDKSQQPEELLENNALNRKQQENKNFLAADNDEQNAELKQVNENAVLSKSNEELQEYEANYKNLMKEKQALSLRIKEILKLNAQTAEAYEKVLIELSRAKAQIKALQFKLLQNDAQLYKLEKAKQLAALEDDDNNHAIIVENKSLFQQLQQMLEKQQALQHMLDQQALKANSQSEIEQQNLILQQRLQEVELELKASNNEKALNQQVDEKAKQEVEHDEKTLQSQKAQPKSEAATNITAESDHTELKSLREKVKSLEAQLQQAYSADNQQRADRIELLKQLLEKQSQKVTQLNAAQADWEELLVQLNTAHAQEAAASTALQQQRIEFEELNARFHDQNSELQKLHQLNLQQNQLQAKELLELQQTCQQQRDSLEAQATLIESLHSKNQCFEKYIDEDYAQEVIGYKKDLRLLRQQVAKLNNERADFSSRMHDMEQELHELRKSKRQAIVVPEIVFPDSDTESQLTVESGNESGRESANNNSKENLDDHMRILTKVLEHEYKHKMQRYDLHIRTLLNNVKRLKRALAAEEQKSMLLQSEQQISTSLETQELQFTQRQLLETRQRYEQSQHVVKSLELQLAALQQQYEATDAAKSNVQEPSHEVANLIDDYKKLIQQSAAASKRPKPSVILDLIQRSNQNVPNLNKLESSIDDLRHDIQQYIGASQAALSLGNTLTHAHSRPSLLDELKLAAVAHS